MRRRFVIVGIAALGLAVAAGCGGKKQEETAARVNGQDITRRQVQDFIERQSSGSSGGNLTIGSAFLNELIVRQAERQKAKERGFKASQDEITQRLEYQKDLVLVGTGKPWDQWLAENGRTQAEIEDDISAEIVIAKLLIPDSDRKAWFEKAENRKALAEQPQFRDYVIYRRVVVGTKDEAEALRKPLAEAKEADVAKLVKDKSQDKLTKDRGGLLAALKGAFPPGQESVEKAIYALKPGEVSTPLPYQDASPEPGTSPAATQWQVLQLVKHHPAVTPTLQNAAETIEQAIESTDQFRYQKSQFDAELLGKAKIEILNPRYKELEPVYQRQREQMEQMKKLTGGAGGMGGAGGGSAMPPGAGGAAPVPQTRTAPK